MGKWGLSCDLDSSMVDGRAVVGKCFRVPYTRRAIYIYLRKVGSL